MLNHSTLEQKKVSLDLYKYLKAPKVTPPRANMTSFISSHGGRFMVRSGQREEA